MKNRWEAQRLNLKTGRFEDPTGTPLARWVYLKNIWHAETHATAVGWWDSMPEDRKEPLWFSELLPDGEIFYVHEGAQRT